MGDRSQSDNSDVIQAVSSIRRNYETELEQVIEAKSYFFKVFSFILIKTTTSEDVWGINSYCIT